VRDTLTGEERELRARVVVNASGPWFDRLAAKLAPHPRRLIRTTKGVHYACEPLTRHAVVLFSPIDGRLIFAIPWLGSGWVGTTDTDYDGDPGEARATSEDLDYLRRSAAGFLPQAERSRIHYTTAGVRALVMQPGSESDVSRLHRIDSGPAGVISVLGGKITGYRAIAEEATDRLCRELGAARKADTAEAPLPVGPGEEQTLEARGSCGATGALPAPGGLPVAPERARVPSGPGIGGRRRYRTLDGTRARLVGGARAAGGGRVPDPCHRAYRADKQGLKLYYLLISTVAVWYMSAQRRLVCDGVTTLLSCLSWPFWPFPFLPRCGHKTSRRP
jgi:hypothetical protein